MRQLTRALAAMAALSVTPACVDDHTTDADVPGFDDDFARASRTTGVPADLLAAVSYVETQWQEVRGEEEHEGRPAGVGVFALWGDNLVGGDASIDGAAKRLAALARHHGVAGADLAAWSPVLAAFSQNPDDESRAAYVNDVMRVLSEGARVTAEDGTVIASIEMHPDVSVVATGTPRATADYPGAIFRASPNYNSRGGTPVSLVVIHSCEGNYAGCWGWLANSAAGASAHYVVKENGAEVTQLVREANRAWHVAANYECSRAGSAQCNRNGQTTNNFSVGIEHAGFASQASWQNGLIETSAKLTCDITRDHGVPRDRNHIVSHGQLQPWNRTDPGPNWPWSHYIDRIRAHCGEGGGGSAIIVDSNNANNNAAVARVELTGSWTSSASTPGYYGSGYWYADTAATSAPATFWFYLPAAQTRTVDAWWTTSTNRATAAPFVAYNAEGTELGRRPVNQQVNGSQWVTLGTWSFSAGWNRVVLSRWTTPGQVVIADAVRVR
ncbi:MAG TPA: N-acetylmuramoyl-L-alanine amidase [Kofleriaceae bacterium]|nr:N-acetylmuramoyl-L-alanine amidase [Kofleriaceae bacterium]